ncbi:SiaB family protein kinase [Paenibacillus silviterrae]|uniref:SiaB family protein kinase n=1 Tax=Paenibacillus silviterrae TaxID=3242194 RepID=UPI0025438AC2|nr:SiaB family protein kinase [Paenibacillus chinjuensis]
MTNHLYEVQSFLRQKKILISFSGRLSQGLIEEYGAAVRKYLEDEERPTSEIREIFSIFIEQTQNIKNYCLSKQGSPSYERIASSSIVTIGKEEDGSIVSSGNLVENKDVEELKDKLKHLIGLDKAELKKLYKELLKRELPDGCSGAGIGLVEMARKTSKPLEYTVTRIDDEVSFFTLKAVV